MSGIIRHKNVQSNTEDPVSIVKNYTLQSTTHSVGNNNHESKVDIGFLRAEIRLLKSRNARLENEIKSEVKMLTAALDGEQETYDQVKRRISRLKGSLEYPGHT